MEEKIEDIQNTLDDLKEKVEAIDKKTGNKWILPISIVVLTAILGSVNYLIEKNVDKNYISDLKRDEIFAEFEAESKRDFYKEARLKLIELDVLFEAYCKFLDQKSQDKLDDALADFMIFYKKQQFIEYSIIEEMKNYSEYVSESAFKIGSGNMELNFVDRELQNSKALHKTVILRLEKGLKNLNP